MEATLSVDTGSLSVAPPVKLSVAEGATWASDADAFRVVAAGPTPTGGSTVPLLIALNPDYPTVEAQPALFI